MINKLPDIRGTDSSTFFRSLCSVLFLFFPIFLFSCADSAMYDREPPPSNGDGNGEGDWRCTRDADCPPGLICISSECVSPEDERPPEEVFGHLFMKPQASARFIYALSSENDTLAIIDAATLAIDTVPLAAEPHDMAVLPERDALAVVSREGRMLTLLEEINGIWHAEYLPLDRRYPAISICPEGKWAVLWTPDGTNPDAGAEGIVGIVNLDEMGSGTDPVVEKAAGRRHTDVIFRKDGGSTDIVIVGKEEIALIETGDLDRPVPVRMPIPEAYTDIRSRQVLASSNGDYAILRSFVKPELLIFHTEDRGMTTMTLPAPATDLAIIRGFGADMQTYNRGIVALRSINRVGWFDLDLALSNPDIENVNLIEIEGVLPGQLTPSDDGRFVAVFTNTEPADSIAWIDFMRDEVLVFDRLKKWVKSVGIGPDGRTAIVVHRPDPNSTLADPYERAVAKDEGYSIVNLQEGYAQLKLTEGVAPVNFVFSVDQIHAAVILSDGNRTHRIDAMNLRTMTTNTLSLASKPGFSGELPAATSGGADRIWITQDHPAGRISFVSLSSRTIRTVTGYHLNAEIE